MKIFKYFTFNLLTIILSTIFVFATTAIVPTQEQLIVGSRIILRGTVLSNIVRRDDPTLTTFTYTTLKVSTTYKGTVPEEIVIKEPGGILNNFGSVIFGTPEFSVGEDVVLFLDSWPDGSLRVHQWFLGKFTISGDKISKSSGGNKVHILNSEALNTNPENFSYFENNLKRNISKFRWESAKHELKFYSSQINFKPQELNTSISNFTFLNPNFPMRWFEPDTNQSVVFKVNPTGMPNGFSITNLNSSFAAWSTVQGSSLRVINGGNTSGCGLLTLDGENTVSFNNCDNYNPFSPPAGGCSGILAAAGIIQYNPTQTKVVNAITFYRAVEANLSFNPYASCYFNNICNVQEVASHELGHTLGFGHSLDDDATMRAYAHFDGRCFSIKPDDQNGARFIYPAGINPAPTPTPVPPTGIAKRGDFTSDGKADPAIWNGTTSYWYILKSETNTVQSYYWGTSLNPYNDIPAVADFDSDMKQDISVFRWLNGYWHIILSSSGGQRNQIFGQRGDLPLAGNWDRDRIVDLAFYRPSNGNFYVLQSSTNTTRVVSLGGIGWQPLKMDVDGDSVLDFVVFRDGNWNFITSVTDQFGTFNFGESGDIPVPADYYGQNKDSFAVWKPSTGYWSIFNSQTQQTQTILWGLGNSFYGDVPQPADYFADTRAEIAVYRRSDFNWYILNLATGQYLIKTFGQINAIPVTF
ncbi:MAG TPA: matrixin family metalloprotease [Leptospiraceae bacterium]|nr:matrixin family metalloprotease [Leptospiraceae bacterium]